MTNANTAKTSGWRRGLRAVRHSLRWRLVLVFLVLAVFMSVTMLASLQNAFTLGWREAARPLLMDYVDHLARDIGSPPSQAQAQALVQRLPITVSIHGPVLNWQSHPDHRQAAWQADRPQQSDWEREKWGGDKNWARLLTRTTADGHTIVFGIDDGAFERRPTLVLFALGALLLLTLLAYLYVRRLLRPLGDIRAGAKRFGAGNFDQPIAIAHARHPDELGELAATVNTMGSDIHHMLEAKRTLLLAISHELRSPLTRARLNTELLPESSEVTPSRDALLRDLALMRDLITDLLESERLASPHAALQREPTDLCALVGDVVRGLPGGDGIEQVFAPQLPALALDATRVRLLVRNLLDNALRHSDQATRPPCISIQAREGITGQGVEMTVRDFGPGVPDDQLGKLAQPFYRPDSARQRSTGGVGLGLYLCKLVAQAHGGTFSIRNAQPGLCVTVVFPAAG
jgi:signal transduction histidine kinase